jgi:zinc/manganese transport system substrate-binding protein
MARLIREIRKHNITGIFLENLSNKQLLAQIAREANVTIGGTLYADSLSHREGSAPTYITMMLHNARVIASSLEIKPALSNNGY